jgi:hypothetical protein
LEGEITLINGDVWIARPHAGGLRVDGPSVDPAEGAAMLTVAHVEQWVQYTLARGLDQQELEAFITGCAERQGLDAKRPFPFVIEGELTDLQMHVINGACPMRPGARLASDQQPWRYELDGTMPARVVGFYAADSVGKMTHPGTSVHAHAVFEIGGITVTGHVERMAAGPGTTLRLPTTR